MLLPNLTPKEQSVAHYLLDLRAAIANAQLRDVAQHSNVSEAMVVKVAKKLGYGGFRELRDALYSYSQLPVSDMHQELDVNDTSERIVDKVFNTAIQALQETLAILDIDDFNKAVQAVYGAKQRDFYGLGGSAVIAHDAAHKFLRIGIRATAYEDSHLMMMSASLLDERDVVLAISHSGQTRSVLDAVRLAKRNGASIIALSNYNTSPLTDVADIVLCSTAQGSPLMGENAAARIAQLNILDALFVCVAQQDYSHAAQSLDATMSSVEQKREG